MSEFPKKLTGDELQKLHDRAAIAISEEKINYYRDLLGAFAEFYGIIPVKKVFEILTDSYGEELSEEAFLALCEFFRYEQKNYFYIFGKEEYYEDSTDPASAPMDRLLAHEVFVQFEDAYEKIISLKVGKPWYIPPKEMMENYAIDNKIEKNDHYHAIINFLSAEFGLSTDDAEYKAYDAIHTLTMENHTFDDFLNELQRMGIDDISFEQAEKLVQYYIELNNNTRMPANNGFTPAEAEKLRNEFHFKCDTLFVSEIQLEKTHEKERMENVKNQNQKLQEISNLLNQYVASKQVKNSLPVKRKKIGRNDPCPCGSGKKYKKCCGR